MIRPPQPTIYLIILDVSAASLSSGLLGTVARTIGDVIKGIPDGDGSICVVFSNHDSALGFFFRFFLFTYRKHRMLNMFYFGKKLSII